MRWEKSSRNTDIVHPHEAFIPSIRCRPPPVKGRLRNQCCPPPPITRCWEFATFWIGVEKNYVSY